jgi:hypothetical protein
MSRRPGSKRASGTQENGRLRPADRRRLAGVPAYPRPRWARQGPTPPSQRSRPAMSSHPTPPERLLPRFLAAAAIRASLRGRRLRGHCPLPAARNQERAVASRRSSRRSAAEAFDQVRPSNGACRRPTSPRPGGTNQTPLPRNGAERLRSTGSIRNAREPRLQLAPHPRHERSG